MIETQILNNAYLNAKYFFYVIFFFFRKSVTVILLSACVPTTTRMCQVPTHESMNWAKGASFSRGKMKKQAGMRAFFAGHPINWQPPQSDIRASKRFTLEGNWLAVYQK